MVDIVCSCRVGSARGVLRGETFALAQFLRAQFRRHLPGEVVHLEHPAQLDFGAAVERRALQPFNRFLLRADLPDPVAGNQFLGLGKWSIYDCARRSEEHTSELQTLMRISYAVFCLINK